MNFIDNPGKLRGFEKNIKVEKVSRRSILKGLGITGGFVLAAPVMSRQAFAYETGAGKMPHGVVVDPRVFVAVAPDGTVTILAHRSEMGTGVRTSLPLIVAEEMEADWSRVKVQQAHGDEVTFGNQDTDGSRSTRHYLIPMRQIGASARSMLEQAAAKRWGVPATEVKAVNHEVVHAASGRKLGFGELAADAAKESVPSIEGLKLKDPKDFRYLGKGQVSIVDLHDITTGKARYGADVRLSGMKYAVIARPPVTGGKLVSFDPEAALKVPGVEKVMQARGWPWPSKFQPLGGVAVIARNTGAAIKGRDALKLVWDDGANGKYDSVAYRKELEEASRKPGPIIEVGCWAHARRKFFEIARLKKAPIAIEAIAKIDALFAIEREINGLPAHERKAVRDARSRPLVDELHAFLRDRRAKLSGKSETAKAIDYSLKRWQVFTRFIDDGRLCMTNNAAERELRAVAVGRKNWTFAGSDDGGRRAAAIYTLIQTAKLNDLDPLAWLTDVLLRINDHPASRLDELLPWNWSKPRTLVAAARSDEDHV